MTRDGEPKRKGRRELPAGVIGYVEETVYRVDGDGEKWYETVRRPIYDLADPPEEPPDPNLLTAEELKALRLKGQLLLPGFE